MDNGFLALIVGLFGGLAAGVINAFFQYYFGYRKQVQEKEHSLKETRYKAVLVLCYTYLYPGNISKLQKMRPDITCKENLDDELSLEFFNMILFADDNVLSQFKTFTSYPTRDSLVELAVLMRKDMFGKNTKVDFETLFLYEEILS